MNGSRKTSSIAAVTITGMGAALVLAVAIETIWSGSPVRWWAAGATVLCAAATIVILRRSAGWTSRVATAGETLLGVAAVLLVVGAGSVGHITRPPAVGPDAGSTPAPPGSTPGSPGPATGLPTASTPEPTADQVQRAGDQYRTAVAGLKASIDPAALEVSARQAKLGTDPRAIARFVQDQIGYEPYAGALRGPRGTLLAGAGNSIDRALLLAGLLRSAGCQVRFAEGTLTADQAEALVLSGFTPARSAAVAQPVLNQIRDRAFSTFVQLADVLDESGFRAPATDAGRWVQAVRETQQHVWVQLNTNGQWVDVDPAAGVAYGRSLVAASRTVDELDPTLSYRVEFRVDVEMSRNGAREIRPLLEHAVQSAEVAGMPLGFFHETQSESVTPVLLIGSQLIKGTALPSARPQPTLARRFGSAFGGLPVQRHDSPTAEWLHIRVTGPAGEREVAYTIFDTVGPAARRAGDRTTAQPDPENGVSDVFDASFGIVILSGAAPFALVKAIVADVPDPMTSDGMARLLAAQSFAQVAARSALHGSLLDTQPFWYIDSPNVIVSRAQVDYAARTQGRSIDLTLKSYRTLRAPQDPLKDKGAFYDYLSSAVLDHTVERVVLGGDDGGASVGTLFEAAYAHGVIWRVAMPGKEPRVGHLSADGQDRVTADLGKKRIVIIPDVRPEGWRARLGWWSIDPATGWAEDTTEDGYHGDTLPGDATLRNQAALRYKAYCGLGVKVAAVAIRVGGLFLDPEAAFQVEVAAGVLDAAAGTCSPGAAVNDPGQAITNAGSKKITVIFEGPRYSPKQLPWRMLFPKILSPK